MKGATRSERRKFSSLRVCKQKRITVDENFLRSLLVAPFILPGAFLHVVLVVLAAAAHVLVAAHTHLILVVLVTIHLSIFFLRFSDPRCKFIFVCCRHHLWSHLHYKVAA